LHLPHKIAGWFLPIAYVATFCLQFLQIVIENGVHEKKIISNEPPLQFVIFKDLYDTLWIS
jgi:hypothetical protein